MNAALAEAVFRAVLAVARPTASGPSWHTPAYLCLAVGKEDASDSLLQRLGDVRPPVVAASACENRAEHLLRKLPRESTVVRSPDSLLTPVYRPTGERAWRISIDPQVVSYDGKGEWAVRASHFVAPLWAGGWRCIATRQRGVWTVGRCFMEWIS